jgi:hypothetical protein
VLQRFAAQRDKAIDALAKVRRLRGHQNPGLRGQRDHDSPLPSRTRAARCAGLSAPVMVILPQ